jgi:hypothetical protein
MRSLAHLDYAIPKGKGTWRADSSALPALTVVIDGHAQSTDSYGRDDGLLTRRTLCSEAGSCPFFKSLRPGDAIHFSAGRRQMPERRIDPVDRSPSNASVAADSWIWAKDIAYCNPRIGCSPVPYAWRAASRAPLGPGLSGPRQLRSWPW